MRPILEWAEAQQDNAITERSLIEFVTGRHGSAYQPMMDADAIRLSKELWSFLNLNIVGKARNTFDNGPILEGFEAWRRIVVPIAPRTMGKKHELHSKVHSPGKAARLSDLENHLENFLKSRNQKSGQIS